MNRPSARRVSARRRTCHAERGYAATELAILLPLLVTIAFGIIDFGRIFHTYVSVSNAAHQAAIFASRAYEPPSAATLRTVALAESGGSLEGSDTSVSAASVVTGERVRVVRVTVTHTFRPLSLLPIAGTIPISLTAAAPQPGQLADAP